MAKISLKINLNGPEENLDLKLKGIKTDNKIVYKENNVMVNINIIDDNKIIMNRNCNEYEIELVFDKNNKTISSYKLFGASKNFELETITNNLKVSENNISIDYNLEGNDFKFNLEVISC